MACCRVLYTAFLPLESLVEALIDVAVYSGYELLTKCDFGQRSSEGSRYDYCKCIHEIPIIQCLFFNDIMYSLPLE
jgi:hypothetical protein